MTTNPGSWGPYCNFLRGYSRWKESKRYLDMVLFTPHSSSLVGLKAYESKLMTQLRIGRSWMVFIYSPWWGEKNFSLPLFLSIIFFSIFLFFLWLRQVWTARHQVPAWLSIPLRPWWVESIGTSRRPGPLDWGGRYSALDIQCQKKWEKLKEKVQIFFYRRTERIVSYSVMVLREAISYLVTTKLRNIFKIHNASKNGSRFT